MPHAISPENSSQRAEDGDAVLAAEQPTPPSNGANKTKIDDIFDDEDPQDEFPSSPPISTPAAPKTPSGGRRVDNENMRAFYQRLFPYRQLFQWLNHSATPTTEFSNREFAFTLQNDAYLRYQSFPTADLFRKQCVAQVPLRFEIGPVYSTNPRDRKTLRRAAAFKPISKELVFDIDMTDYDDIRTCCDDAKICGRCWAFMRMAVKVIDAALREDFGFKHILWVFSGRRGIHAWVCDKSARDLDDNKRKSIAGYFELLKGGDAAGKKVSIRRPMHPHLERSLDILKPYFASAILQDQDPWGSEKGAKALLALLPDPKLVTALQQKWESSYRTSTQKWNDIHALASAGAGSLDGDRIREARQDIILEYTYPRLDAAVSKHLNHLLKSPFCIHPKTGNVCVPIDPAKLESFDPLNVPTVSGLLTEVDQWHQEHQDAMEEDGEKKMQDWEKTSLKPYVDHFRGFVANLLKEEMSSKRGREAGEGVDF